QGMEKHKISRARTRRAIHSQSAIVSMTKKNNPLLTSVKKIVVALDDKKAIHVQVLDMRNLVTYTDFIIVCSGTSAPHMNALMEHVEEALADDMKPVYRNSSKDRNWLILDYVDVVVHV